MLSFNALETAALQSIFEETPEIADLLRQQFEVAHVVKRENTGGGFLTTMAVPVGTPGVSGPKVLGYETNAYVEGLPGGLGFALFMEEGRLHLLDGHAWGDNTIALDFAQLKFSITKKLMSN